MMLAPSKVPVTLKEVTGNMMTLSYNVGLTAGSLIGKLLRKLSLQPVYSLNLHLTVVIISGYVFESMLGPPLSTHCPTYPYIPLHPATTNASLAFTSTTITAATSTAFPIPSTLFIPKIRETTTTVASMTTAGVAIAVAASTASLPEQTTRLVTSAVINATDYVFNSSMMSGL